METAHPDSSPRGDGQGTAGPLVNVIGPYNGVVAVGAGPALVEVLADGNWTVAAQ